MSNAPPTVPAGVARLMFALVCGSMASATSLFVDALDFGRRARVDARPAMVCNHNAARPGVAPFWASLVVASAALVNKSIARRAVVAPLSVDALWARDGHVQRSHARVGQEQQHGRLEALLPGMPGLQGVVEIEEEESEAVAVHDLCCMQLAKSGNLLSRRYSGSLRSCAGSNQHLRGHGRPLLTGKCRASD